MKRFPVVYILAAVVATLSGCGGGSTQLAPTDPQGVLRRLEGRPPASVAASGAWMSSHAKGSSLLYVADTVGSAVNVYSAATFDPFGILVGFANPHAMCVDAAQDVYVPDSALDRITEYAHGAVEPKRTLADDHGDPVSCAVDPKSGDLAISNAVGPSSTLGSVIVYHGAKGSPAKYTASGFQRYLFIGYDDTGNLFLDGLGSGSEVQLAELRKGKSTFKSIAMNQAILSPGAVVWDGAFLAVGDTLANTIYQFKVAGSKATVHGSTTLGGAAEVFQFWLTGGTSKHPQATGVLGADFAAGAVYKWPYPAGGKPLKSITGLEGPEGVAISQ